ncbi:MAG TPA: hypothetical protein DEB05_01320 [Firmicutes bacterium]|jgi:hypothetical protein|nr:hypothetical protein [Bacillota bacterium]
MIFLVILGFGLIVVVEVPSLIRRQYWRELVVFSFFIFVGLLLTVFLTLGVELPYIDVGLTKLITGLGEALGLKPG